MGGTVKSEKKSKQDVINLESSGEEESDNNLDIKPAAVASKKKVKQEVKVKKEINVKREVKTETPKRGIASPSRKNIKFVSPSGPSPKKKKDLKPLFEVGEEVYAGWWDPKEDPKRKKEPRLYPGKVTSFNEVGSSLYGPVRLYNVAFDDGDKIEALSDLYISSKEDTILRTQFEVMGKGRGKGVMAAIDIASSDEWASKIGWYEVKINEKMHSYSLLSDAHKAYDAHVVRTKGMQTKKSDLNNPDDYHWLFVKSLPAKSIKREVKQEEEETDDENFSGGEDIMIKKELKKEEEDTDDDSHFSKADQESEAKHPSKRRKSSDDRDLSSNDEVQLLSVADRFTKESFMTQPIFHLNAFLSSSKKRNEGFGLFIKLGVATPCYEIVLPKIIQQLGTLTQSQVRQALIEDEFWLDWEDDEKKRNGGASQIAMWLKEATTGSFVIMRHEYKNCPHTPARLKPDGKYMGPIYVIGMVTKVVTPWSNEETRISNRLGASERVSNLCLVDWKWLGRKDTLKKETRDVLVAVCQSTVTRMCIERSEPYKNGGTPESVREDLWNNAVEMIRPHEFNDASKLSW